MRLWLTALKDGQFKPNGHNPQQLPRNRTTRWRCFSFLSKLWACIHNSKKLKVFFNWLVFPGFSGLSALQTGFKWDWQEIFLFLSSLFLALHIRMVRMEDLLMPPKASFEIYPWLKIRKQQPVDGISSRCLWVGKGNCWGETTAQQV